MRLAYLAMDHHSGALVLQPLHRWVWCNTWYYYSCRNPELTGGVSCGHTSISTCWNQKGSKITHSNTPAEAKITLTLI